MVNCCYFNSVHISSTEHYCKFESRQPIMSQETIYSLMAGIELEGKIVPVIVLFSIKEPDKVKTILAPSLRSPSKIIKSLSSTPTIAPIKTICTIEGEH